MRILVTGANGFVGRALCSEALARGAAVRGVTRAPCDLPISDGEDVSTTELLRRMGQALGRPAPLIPVSVSWLKLTAAMVGKPDVAQRLCGSLQVDIKKTRQLLGWTPPLSLDEGLKKAAEGLRV